MLEFTEFHAKDVVVKSLVDRYVLVNASTNKEVQTLPNGRVDGTIILKGSIEWFFKSQNQFKQLPACAFYPLTSSQNRARTTAGLTCIGIKFFPHVVGLTCFNGVRMNEPISFDAVFGSGDVKDLTRNLKQAEDVSKMGQVLDAFFKEKLISRSHYQWLAPITKILEHPEGMQIDRLASTHGMNIKMLERKFAAVVGLTPKLFARIVQLQHAARAIAQSGTKNQHGNLIEALDSGYYDQAHFIKSCKKITGMTPKRLFKQMPKEMTDILVLE